MGIAVFPGAGDGACTPWEKGESAAEAGEHENGASPEGNGEAPGKKCSVFILRRCPWLRLR